MAYIRSGGGNFPVKKLKGQTFRIVLTYTGSYVGTLDIYFNGVRVYHNTNVSTYTGGITYTIDESLGNPTDGAYILKANYSHPQTYEQRAQIILNDFVIYDSGTMDYSKNIDSGTITIQ